jgi:hypothetical protein
MAGYEYRGTGRDALEAPRLEKPKKDKAPRKTASCGTSAGYQGHRRNGEKPCEACRLAYNEVSALRRGHTFTGRKNSQVPVCGTYSGFRAHERRGEEACLDCKDARNVYQRERRAARKAQQRPDLPEGMVTIGQAMEELLDELEGAA